MAALRLTLVLVLIFCSTKALFLEPRAWTAYDQEHGQYSMAVLSAETTALRYRVYVLTLEVSHTTKYIDQEIIALFNQSGTDAAKIAELEAEFTKRGQSMLVQTQRIMDSCVDMATLTGSINEDIASSTFADMSMNKLLLNNQYENFAIVYELSMDNAFMSAAMAKNKVITTIGTQTGTQMDEINALTAEAELLLTSHRKLCDDQKLFVDQAYTVGDAALTQLIATIP